MQSPKFESVCASGGCTELRYNIPEKERVTIKLYNITGRLVKELENGIKRPGEHSVNIGNEVSSGVYFAELVAGHYRSVKSVVVVR